LIVMLVVIDPVGVAPVFASMTASFSPAQQRHLARRGVMVAAGILYAFALTGHLFLTALGIGLPAFQIAGGILLFVLAIEMILVHESGIRTATQPEQEEAGQRADISVFPLAIPLIAGPGAITSTVLLMRPAWSQPWLAVGLLAVIAVALLVTLATLLVAARLTALLGVTGASVISRVFGIILAALAVQFVLNGLEGTGLLHVG